MVRQVTAFSNSTVKLLRSLRDKKARKSEGLFLAEGLRILAEARDSGRLPEIIAFSPDGAKHPLAAEIIAATEAAGGDAIDRLVRPAGRAHHRHVVDGGGGLCAAQRPG